MKMHENNKEMQS